MMKIKNIRHLRKERRRLEQREKELKDQIRSDWRHLKNKLSFYNLFNEQRDRFEYSGRNGEDENILKSTLSVAARLLMRTLVKKAEKIFG